NPQKMLSINGGMNIDQANVNNGALEPGFTLGDSSGEGIASKRTVTGNQYGLDFYTGFVPRMSITNGGLVGIGTTAPLESLDVRGNIRLGVAANLFVPGSTENLAIIRGTVNSDASKAGGLGYSVTKAGTGAYLLTFDHPFSARPSASVTQIFPDPDD